jgi:predicted peptidase
MRRSSTLAVGFLLAAAFIAGCGSSGHVKTTNAKLKPGLGFQHRKLQGYDNRQYAVFLPANYSPDKKFPAIMFLHGVGERGSNAGSCLNVGIGPEIAKRADKFPFVVIFPQVNGSWKSAEDEKIAIDTLEQAKREFSIDPDRVMLTGLSTGGYGTWRIGAKYRDRFAALVPMCGYSYKEGVRQLTTIPIWCWHYSGDWAVGSGNSKDMVNRVNKAGGNAKLSMPGGLGHDVWTVAYDDPSLYQWMMSQRRGGGSTAGSSNAPALGK